MLHDFSLVFSSSYFLIVLPPPLIVSPGSLQCDREPVTVPCTAPGTARIHPTGRRAARIRGCIEGDPLPALRGAVHCSQQTVQTYLPAYKCPHLAVHLTCPLITVPIKLFKTIGHCSSSDYALFQRLHFSW